MEDDDIDDVDNLSDDDRGGVIRDQYLSEAMVADHQEDMFTGQFLTSDEEEIAELVRNNIVSDTLDTFEDDNFRIEVAELVDFFLTVDEDKDMGTDEVCDADGDTKLDHDDDNKENIANRGQSFQDSMSEKGEEFSSSDGPSAITRSPKRMLNGDGLEKDNDILNVSPLKQKSAVDNRIKRNRFVN